MLPMPNLINQYWYIKSADNQLRVVLSDRSLHHLYYTSLEKCCPELGDGIWTHVPGSACGHGTNEQNALARVERLVVEWKDYIK